MYRITKEVAFYLLDNSKDFQLPNVDDTTDKPFTIRNLNAIGSISPILVTGSDCKYLVEIDPGEFGFKPLDVAGYFLYKRSDLKKIDDVFEVPRAAIDRYCSDSEAFLDITDCVVELPSAIEKLTSLQVKTVERLFELEPGLVDCLDIKDTSYGQNQIF